MVMTLPYLFGMIGSLEIVDCQIVRSTSTLVRYIDYS